MLPGQMREASTLTDVSAPQRRRGWEKTIVRVWRKLGEHPELAGRELAAPHRQNCADGTHPLDKDQVQNPARAFAHHTDILR